MAITQSEQGIFGITLAISWLPTVCAVLALVFILLSPINERRHQIIRRRLDTMVTRLKKRNASGKKDIVSPLLILPKEEIDGRAK